MICTIYSHYLVLDRITGILHEVLPDAEIKVARQENRTMVEALIKEKSSKFSLFKKTSKIKIAYRERTIPSYYISETENSPLTENLRGMYGFVNSLPTKNEDVKNRFLQKILTINSEFSIDAEGEVNVLGVLIPTFAHDFDAFVFAQPGLPISRSDGQHFLDKNLQLIIDTEGNCEVDTLEINIESKYFDEPATPTERQQTRKDRSEAILREHTIRVNASLPCIQDDETTELRKPQDIARRICILAMTNYVAFGNLTGDEAASCLKQHGLWEYATKDEKLFLANPIEEKKSHETWKCEDIWLLMWAIKRVDDLYFPDKLCSLDNIPYEEYPVGPGKDPNTFITAIKESRNKSEILDAADLHYRINWACVDARIYDEEIARVHPGVVYERCYALNWLIRYRGQEWDSISCDT